MKNFGSHRRNRTSLRFVLILVLLLGIILHYYKVESFSPLLQQLQLHQRQHHHPKCCSSMMIDENHHHQQGVVADVSRRQWIKGGAAAGVVALSSLFFVTTTRATASVANAANDADIRGIPLTPFNGLIFNYRGSDFGGLGASSLKDDEPSISYQDFVQKLNEGKVAFVEFLAPYGDIAYVTFKEDASKPIRIGEGFPIEKHDGWSSPAFAIRTVANAGVPYKFTVPALTKKYK